MDCASRCVLPGYIICIRRWFGTVGRKRSDNMKDKIILAQKIRLSPNYQQRVFFQKSAGIARLAYNWGLAEWKRQYGEWKELYDAGKADKKDQPSEAKLLKKFTEIKRSEFPFVLEVSKTAPQQAFKNLGTAYKNTFRRLKKGEKGGFPKFKKKGIHDSFRPDDGSTPKRSALRVEGKKVKIPKLGWVKMTQELRFKGKIISSVISRIADHWYISFTTEIDSTDLPHKRQNNKKCGIDLGIKTLATLDDGKQYENPKALAKYTKQLAKAQRVLSRREKGSKNREKARAKVARIHYKIACLRNDAQHKATTEIVLNNDFIAVENLNVKGMVKNHKLAKAVSDASMSEFRRQIEYKAGWYDSHVQIVDRFYPSSKTCNNCGEKQDMPLDKRIYVCHKCGYAEDRDINAAKNIVAEGLRELNACGDGSAG